MTLRKLVFWCHLTAGLGAGVVVLIMSVTGVLLAFERQIVEWADDVRVAPPADGSPRLLPEALLAQARHARPAARVSTITLRADPGAPAALGLGREGTLFIDPYRGRVLGEGSRGARDFFQKVTAWHRWLGAAGEGRRLGRAVTGVCNLAFLFLVVSGFCLWWPRQWNRRALAGVTLFRRGLRGRARDFNWHNVAGVWSAVPLFFIVLSAVTLSYPQAPRRNPSGPGPERRAPQALEGLDAAGRLAVTQVPGWRTITVRVPAAGEPATVTIDTSAGAMRPDKRGQLTVDLAAGTVLRWEPYAAQDRGRRLRAWMRWVHTGEAGGWIGQTVAGAAAAGGTLLVWTGLGLAWRRYRAWRRRAPAPSGALLQTSGPSPTCSVQATRN